VGGGLFDRLRFAARAGPGRRPGGAIDVEFREHAGGGRRIPRADFVQAAPIAQFENRFPVPGAASGGARPLNDERRTVQEQFMSKVQFR